MNHQEEINLVRGDLGKAAPAFDVEGYVKHLHELGYAGPDAVPYLSRAALIALHPASAAGHHRTDPGDGRRE